MLLRLIFDQSFTKTTKRLFKTISKSLIQLDFLKKLRISGTKKKRHVYAIPTSSSLMGALKKLI